MIGIYFICILVSALFSVMQVYTMDMEFRPRNKAITAIRFVQILCGFFSVYVFIQVLPIASWISVILGAYLFMLLGIQIPSALACIYDMKITLRFFSIIQPLLHVLTLPLQMNTLPKDIDVSEEDIRELINEGSEIDQPQKEMIENVFEMDDIPIEDICTHRSEVIVLNLDQSPQEWHQIIHDNRHTFYPVCDEDEDDVIGVLDTRDYFRLSDNTSQDHIINHSMDHPFFVSETMKIDELFAAMTNRKNYFAVLVDEYGGMTGIATLHDIMESLVGDIYDEDEIEDPADITKIDSNQWRIYGSAELEDVQDALEIDLKDDENETFNGFVISQYGQIPEDGSRFEIDLDDIVVHVKDVKNHRIKETIVLKKKKEDTNDDGSIG